MRNLDRPKRAATPAILATAALILGIAAGAPRPATAQSPQIAGSAGLQVAIDPQTGKIRRPTAEERKALESSVQSLFNKSVTSVSQAQTWPDGTVGLAVGSEFLNVLVARIEPEGTLSQACVDTAVAADSFFAGSAPVLEEK